MDQPFKDENMPEDVILVTRTPSQIEQAEFQTSAYTAWSRKQIPDEAGWIITFAAYLNINEDTGIDDVRDMVQKLVAFSKQIDANGVAYIQSKLASIQYDPTDTTGPVVIQNLSDLFAELMTKLQVVVSVEKTATQPAPQTDWAEDNKRAILATMCQVVPEDIPQSMPEIQ